jgi:ABC-type transport system involved in multi-copper enzyme maturation permease subunit
MGELWRQEMIKLFSQRYPYLLLGLVLAVQAARILSLYLTPPETTLDQVSAPQLWADGMAWALRLLVYLLLVLGAMAFSREFSLGTAKTVLVLPLSRRRWFAAKLLLVLGVAWAALVLSALLGAALVAFTTGWGPVVREGLAIHSAGEVGEAVVWAVALTAVLIVPLCAFSLWIGLFFASSGAAVGVAVLSGTVLELLAGTVGWGRFLFLAQLHRPVELVGRLGRGLPFRWEPLLGEGIAVAAVSFLVFAGWGLLRLERMDING